MKDVAAGERAGQQTPTLPPSDLEVRTAPLASMLRRLGWGVADQALSSLTNFLVGAYVARTLGTVEFGAYSLAYVTYSFLLNASRGLATDPLVVRHSGRLTPGWRVAVGRATGAATVVGVTGGACCAVGGVVLGVETTVGAAFLALGITLPGLMLQDAWRFVFFSVGLGRRAFVNDAVWGAALVGALVVLQHKGGAPGVFEVSLAWGLTACLAALLGVAQSRVRPRPAQVRRWLVQHRDLAFRYLVENLSLSGAAQLRMYAVGALAGLAAVGAVRGAEMLLGPFFVVMFGLSLVTVPEAVRVLQRAPGRLRTFCLALGALQAVAAAAWGGLLLLLLPRGLGEWLLGDVWRSASVLLLPATLAVLFTSMGVGAASGVRALGASRRSLRAQLVAASAYLVGGVAGAAAGGALGTVWGVAAATALGAAVWWVQLSAGVADRLVEEAAAVTSGRTT
jgi:O-antigen/teichoic acid export membrane protein